MDCMSKYQQFFRTRKNLAITAWMEGYYYQQVQQQKALSDVPLRSLDTRYLRELRKRAEKETKDLWITPLKREIKRL